MLVRTYLPKFISALFGGLFVALGIFTFGNALIFDRIFICVLIATAVYCRKNINVLSAIIIILIQHFVEEFAWLYVPSYDLTNYSIYILGLWVAYYFWHDWVAKLLLLSTTLAIFAELFWIITEYSAPSIAWYITIIIVCVLVRHFIMYRVSYVDNYFPEKGKSINLDWVLYKINALLAITQSMILYEYFLRHILGFSSFLFVYNMSPYLIHSLSTLIIWAAFNESYKQLMSTQLKA